MQRVLLGMSGGVDSSVAAYLLKKDGYEVVGITMLLVEKERDTSIEDAKKVCKKLGIEHHVIDFQEEFKKIIIDNFVSSYQKGETPNPCVLCNKKIKFGLLWQKAQELNCEFIATGHYASIVDNHLCKIDSPKDQSYFMHGIDKEVISHILLPLNKYTNKEEIRDIAEKVGLDIARKKDSQDICFIPDGKYSEFLEKNQNIDVKKGDFVLKNGKVIGQHNGLIYYTIGQRKGLGISYSHPLYVIALDKEKNQVILGEEKDLYSNIVTIEDYNLLVYDFPQKCHAKIRYKSNLTPCKVEIIDSNKIIVTFDKPVKSVTPGQSLVFYDNDRCLGGGIIKSSTK